MLKITTVFSGSDGLPRRVKVAPSHDEKNIATIPTPAAKDQVGIWFPSGLKISAGGQLGIIATSIAFSVMFCCEKMTKLALCICRRLNRNEPPR